MGQFVCRVADVHGRVFSHVEAAASLEEARQKLTERGLYVYSVNPRGGLLQGLRRRGRRALGGSDFLILNQQFNTLIKAGLPILRALDLLADRASSPRLRPVLSQIRDRVREGKSLSEAVDEAAVFSKVYSTAILAGEKSGNLSGVLEYYISYQKVSTGVRKKILATLVYPALLVVVATCIVSYLVAAVIPKFAMLYRELSVQLPAPTRLLITISVDNRWLIIAIVLGLALTAAGIFFWSRSEEGGVAFDRLKYRLPVLGETLLKFQVAQFCRTLATLLAGGTPLVAGLQTASDAIDSKLVRETVAQFCRTLATLLAGGTPLVAGLQTASDAIDSKLVRETVAQATQMVREGESLHRALASKGVLPDMALDMIEVGESSGALAPMLTSVAEFYEDEVSLKLGTLVALIEPIMLIFMGLLVAFILISLYLPIFSFSMSQQGT